MRCEFSDKLTGGIYGKIEGATGRRDGGRPRVCVQWVDVSLGDSKDVGGGRGVLRHRHGGGKVGDDRGGVYVCQNSKLLLIICCQFYFI